MNGTIRYSIKPYDTIWMLAQIFNTTVDSIMELNPGIEPRNLMVGQVITIKPGYQYYSPYSNNQRGTMDNGMNGMNDMNGMNGMREIDYDIEDLTELFRLLWEQHVIWTSKAVTAIIHDLPETDMVIQRLLRNPQDFAKALTPIYGEQAANEFAKLLTEHITIAAELVRAAKAGDNNAVADADQRWHENAEQIAEFLGSINPEWSAEDWSAMMDEHLALLSDYTADLLEGNYQEAINGFDDIEAQALEMADMMADGNRMMQ